MINPKHFKILLVVYFVGLPLFIYDMYVRQTISSTFVLATIVVIVIGIRLKSQQKQRDDQNK